MIILSLIAFLLLLFRSISCIELDITSRESICNAAGLIQDELLEYYMGTRYGGTVGMFQDPYYWWQAGEAFGGLIDMWYFCENNTYEELIYDALMHQRGDNNDYIPANQSLTEGNDDQGFWGFAVLEAVEKNFTNPPEDEPGWLALTQAIFNTMEARWDTEYCNGGLRWQIFTWNNGYNYKNTISNGCLFNIAARLARYTKNETYVEVAERVFDWLIEVEFINITGTDYYINDGGTVEHNCTDFTIFEWTYNFAVFISGCAYLYNFTEDQKWLTHLDGLIESATVNFFSNNIMYEAACQPSGSCNTDQRSFKSVFSRMLSHASILAPTTYDAIRPLIESSAAGAALSCTGGTSGHSCGTNWLIGSNDGNFGLGEQMCALEIIINLLAPSMDQPLTNVTGGTSRGDSSAGLSTISDKYFAQNDLVITAGDKAGAGVLTAVSLGSLLAIGIWMIL
ncbi:glycoside hydrolase family 76 protein [Ascoidea rubescens DSM 1968]|uniref:Mannan endo-1,6-alpha-mannosidase n=1 Tax=Ascoidea rubescens DSM 1968 TaxID=1344418 RepID=A0A1D2VMZ6_9ASCO|nr:glycoside hydrolase family 76 protein [Ascoidea rubescens DSM 1968]ODV62954.1 glycoside hydrolase family 76 protein [Ascoidea rubescens DSM 1968]